MMASLRFTITSTLCACVLTFLPSFNAHGQVESSRRGMVRDLVCPSERATAQKTAQGIPLSPVVMTGVSKPGDAELGMLAKPVVRPQALLPQAQLNGFAPGTSTRPRRLAFWGDSHLSGGLFAATLYQSLRDKGYSVAARFMPPTMGRANVNLPGLRNYCIGTGWVTTIGYTSRSDADIGPALVNRSASAGDDSYLWLDVRNHTRDADVGEIQLIYISPSGASVRYVLDDAKPVTARLPATTESRTLTLRTRAPISTVRLAVSSGKLTLLGVILNRPREPDVTLDVFGVPSATVKGWANADPRNLIQALHGVKYDGVVLEYGTNEGADADFDKDRYANMLTQALSNLRQVFPEASCVLVGPPDRGVLKNKKGATPPLLAYASVHQRIEQTQRQVGSRFGCVVWSWQDLMGGPGGSYGWANAQPSLMGRDLTHLSPDGYRLTGRSLARSLGWMR